MALIPQVGRQQPRLRVAWWIIVTLLCVGVLLHLFPFYFMLVTSITPAQETLKMPPTLWPENPTGTAWKLVYDVASRNSNNRAVRDLMKHPFSTYLVNSLFMTFMTLLLSLPITALAAYANSKLQRGPSTRWTFLYFIGTLMVPGAVTLIPSFLLTRNFPFPMPNPPLMPNGEPFPVISIYDTPWAVIIPGVFSAFNFLLFKGFFDTIPDSIIQAARVDGGSEFNIFRRIVFPMSIPVFAVATWLQFGAVWDSYLWPLVVIQSPEKIPTSVAISNLMTKFMQAGSTNPDQAIGQYEAMRDALEAGLSWNGLMVLGLLQTIPIFIMFIICREYLLRGIRVRGLK
jgi:ABC-type glycerol-3-phosphate transport system permease component